jgi:hypothetical protein
LDEILFRQKSQRLRVAKLALRYIDEVHHSDRFLSRRDVPLKRQTAEVSSWPFFEENCFSTRKRPARTPPSAFLFLPIHLSNSPETVAIPCPPESRRAIEARVPEQQPDTVSLFQ